MEAIFKFLTPKSHRLDLGRSRVRQRCWLIVPPSLAASNKAIVETRQRCFSSVEAGERKPKRMKKMRKLTFETERVLVIRRVRAGRRATCGACGEVVGLVTADEAARVSRVSVRAIYRMVEAGKIHFIETAEQLLICFNSLRRSQLEAGSESFANNLGWEGDDHEGEE